MIEFYKCRFNSLQLTKYGYKLYNTERKSTLFNDTLKFQEYDQMNELDALKIIVDIHDFVKDQNTLDGLVDEGFIFNGEKIEVQLIDNKYTIVYKCELQKPCWDLHDKFSQGSNTLNWNFNSNQDADEVTQQIVDRIYICYRKYNFEDHDMLFLANLCMNIMCKNNIPITNTNIDITLTTIFEIYDNKYLEK